MRTGVVALGGALGAVGRYWISGMVSRLAGASLFPWGTLVVNVGGSFFIGAFLGATTIGRFSVSPNLRVFIAIGVLGALTTYSTFAYETLGALREGDTRMALANIAASLILGLGACWLGLVVGERL
ncbi:MAG: fluoride efflux transporter CrcB [bacterium]|nr:fluoride efflux transporter CrcB [bacterium]